MTEDELLDSFHRSCYKNLTRVRTPHTSLSLSHNPPTSPDLPSTHNNVSFVTAFSHRGAATPMHFITSVIAFSNLFVCVPESGTRLDASANPEPTAGRLARRNEAQRTPSANWRARGRINDGSLPRVSVSLPLVPSHFCQLAAPHPFPFDCDSPVHPSAHPPVSVVSP